MPQKVARLSGQFRRGSRSAYEKAERWYQLEMEMAMIGGGDDTNPSAKARVLKLIAEVSGH